MRLLVILSPTDKWGTKAEYTKLRKFLPRVVRQFSGKTAQGRLMRQRLSSLPHRICLTSV